MNYTYLLRCADRSLYCGWTNHLEERVKLHNAGKGAKYTRSRRPVELAYYETYQTKEDAMKREAAIKKMKKPEKEALVSQAGGWEYSIRTENSVWEENKGRITKIVISPAKRMHVRTDDFPCGGKPVFLEEAMELSAILKDYSEADLKELFKANDSITHKNYLRYQNMDLNKNLSPAVLSYVGIQYQYMAPHLFSKAEWEYAGRHLRILSGFYGLLRADDGITPYRLEMQAKLKTQQTANLYAFWKDKLYRELVKDGGIILNLASKEYSQAVEAFLRPEDEFITCIFGTEVGGKIKVKATEAKMARGEMVRYLAEQGARDLETVKAFNRLNFSFCPERSTEKELIFMR